ncbi:poly-gamma-glutamate biosynthesis protein PgsC [Clostridium cochlearium]|uniref:poly-gamma-glutamate biosynthesis protein PgsC n=2 Tax=Clostridium cochlearium TaxID=1494 RepID=UPI000B94F003|nr:poly-gamma-glutamate biosynthesis protein PgsC [Clostridium cochlearium]MBV1819217.1 poly-gamma-glutamate biosynthesis protein PgsC [Bacteroidales bacterium MSK.15.36]MCG4581092.1 poly-gamma-glutamate biosynthesis protein PgsC [Clostridium cochlearium]SNV68318.1 poly-gamma-glutamate biosynthesis protein PgsC [Clostridium cochlearium]STA91704.1 poly-gamma-glutamate biosynthesis protein PgsC [Clostridium cochlearium]
MANNTMILGIIFSIIYYEVTEVSPGGIIVPGYISLFLTQPLRIIATLILSVLTLVITNILSKYTILYGKRKFSVMIMISFILRVLIEGIGGLISLPIVFSVIGYIIPAIIAKEMDRQGIVKTTSSAIVVACIISLTMIVLGKGILV